MRRPVAVLDACTLVPIRLATTLLWLAEAGLLEPLWSEEILDEVERTLPKLGPTPAQAARRVEAMRDAFGAEAMVDDFSDLIDQMTCDPKDRHVLAAAVRGGASTLVTFNLRDFPAEVAEAVGVTVMHPDTFLLWILDSAPDAVVAALEREVAAFNTPPLTLGAFLASMTSTVPIFANLAAQEWRSPIGDPVVTDVPALELVDHESALAALGGQRGDPTSPGQVAMGWWSSLPDNLAATRALTYDPAAWGDFQQAVDHLAGRALTSQLIPAVDAPDSIAFMKFVPEVAATSRVFEAYKAQATYLTLVRVPDGTWRVWGLGPRLLSARDILGAR
ncbi:PIN domain-containing protein [Nocardioides zhouii]|uniref:PIN domain-containing protein n=1 Tax=Nocardioides zhouii TaxID=1168729 RepID=A0A4Q2SE29_9ACTN|nr:PIN domain-containing protein [Nocardioides zhouii]RYC03585.1 PIN domain-containing protein [Nocardioides zhouii]